MIVLFDCFNQALFESKYLVCIIEKIKFYNIQKWHVSSQVS